MHGSVLGFFAYGALQTREVAGKDVLEVGSLDVNGSIREMVQSRGPASYTGIDVVDGPGVDRVVDAVDLVATFGPSSFDVVVSTEMLEHAEDWQASLANMVTVLRPGGVLVITTRSPGFAWHHPPDRWRYTQQAFARIAELWELEPVVLMDDPEHPGVLVKLRKPEGWPQIPGEPPQHILKGILAVEGVPGVTPMVEPLRILGLPANPDGCGYYRMWQPFTQLATRSGHRVAIPPPGQHDIIPDEDDIAECDVVVQQRPNGRLRLRAWQAWKGRTNLVFEVDDNLLHPDTSGLPDWVCENIQATFRQCIDLADLVTCSTEPLADELRAIHDNVTVLPNYIHEDLLTIERPHRERLTVGWAGGDSHLRDIMLIQDPLRAALAAHEDVDMHFLGRDYSPVIGQGRFTPWQVNVWDYYQKVDFDIGLAPLAPHPFAEGRSPIKARELAALGIPVIASDCEAYRGFVIDGVTGFLARTPDEWQQRLTELINDEAARSELGAKAKQVAADWTIQQGWTKWADAYEQLAGWPTTRPTTAGGST